jgi:hypothetical protein
MESLDDLKSMHIAVYALSLLGGVHQKVHTEDVALKCLSVAPERFRWELYDYADKELVRKALFHASEKKNGALVIGRAGMEQRGKSRDGWQLTPAGAAWVRENSTLLTTMAPEKQATMPRREAERLIKKLRAEQAYRIFANDRDVTQVTPYMFTDLLNCSPDAPQDVIRAKFRRLLANAELLGSRDILEFLRSCEARFANLLTDSASVGGAA